jgi:hypothetical protein
MVRVLTAVRVDNSVLVVAGIVNVLPGSVVVLRDRT